MCNSLPSNLGLTIHPWPTGTSFAKPHNKTSRISLCFDFNLQSPRALLDFALHQSVPCPNLHIFVGAKFSYLEWYSAKEEMYLDRCTQLSL